MIIEPGARKQEVDTPVQNNPSGSDAVRVTALIEDVNATFTPGDRHRLIAQAAFDRASLRGFLPGYEVEDWLVAEREFEAAGGLIEPTPRWDLPQPRSL